MPKLTAIYARYSSHAQDGGTSIDVQIEACSRGLEHCLEYIDRARTGRSMVGREALLRLLADAEAGKIDRVVVYKYDRLGRNLAETSAIIAQLEDCGVEVGSVTEGKDALARGMHLVISEHYSRALAERTHAGLVKRFEQKSWTGGPAPYGYMVEKLESGRHLLKVNPQEAEVVRWLFQTYTSESVGMKGLARSLRGKGIPTRKCPIWTFTSVRRILTNDISIGKLVYNRRRFKLNKNTGRRVPVWRDPSEHFVQQDEALRIVTDEMFAEAAQRLAEHARGSSGRLRTPAHRAFTGLIFCEVCGSVCYHRFSKNRKGEYHYYGCGCRQRNGAEACGNYGAVREDVLIQAVTNAYQRLFDNADTLVEDVLREARKVADANRGEVQRVRGQMAEIDKKIGPMMRLLADPDIDATAKKAISRQLGELESERERLLALSVEVAEQASEDTDRLAKSVRRALDEARETLATAATPAELRDFIEQFVGPMVLKPDGTVAQKNTPTSVGTEVGVIRPLAGVGFEPTTLYEKRHAVKTESSQLGSFSSEAAHCASRKLRPR